MDFASCFVQDRPILFEGALGLRLNREFGLEPDETVAWASQVYGEKGRNALSLLYSGYIETAREYGLPFAATTPTRRANRERVAASGYGKSIIADNVGFLKALRDASGMEMYAGGLMGCKGDAYKGTDALPLEDAYAFHSWQAELFAAAGADFLYAGIMPVLSEAAGMAKAMEKSGLPYIISFMIRENGRLIDGTAIHDAIGFIDDATVRKPVCYMVNCVHPSVLYKALSMDFNRTERVKERFSGIQANASPLSPEELDGSSECITSDAKELADGIFGLNGLIRLKIVGGCCGTENAHLAEIAKRL
jgi:S-methylmethionine-dependent homocysteine/selenocysteine methylase